MRRILLGSDGSRYAQKAEERVLSLAKGGDSILALHVVSTDLMHYGLVDQLATQGDKEDFLRYVRELGERESRDKLGGFLERAREQGLDARLSVRWGEPLREILAAAVESAADEVFLPPQGWGVDFTVPGFMARINRSSPCKVTILA